jgi:hypothetical protein
LIGPTLDRIPGGRRFVVQITAVVRAVLFIAIAFHADDLLLFPLVFGVMVMQKTYAVSKSALVPLVVRNEQELVEANSKLGLISGLAAAVAVGPLGGLAKISPALALVPGAALFIAAALAARKLPRDPVATRPAKRAERLELRSPGLILAAGAMVLCRATVGFLLFHLLFWMREDYGLVWLGVALGAFGVGSMLGSLLAPVLRRMMREETMLTAALGTIAAGGVVAAFIGGVGSAVMLAAVVVWRLIRSCSVKRPMQTRPARSPSSRPDFSWRGCWPEFRRCCSRCRGRSASWSWVLWRPSPWGRTCSVRGRQVPASRCRRRSPLAPSAVSAVRWSGVVTGAMALLRRPVPHGHCRRRARVATGVRARGVRSTIPAPRVPLVWAASRVGRTACAARPRQSDRRRRR